MKSRRSSSRGMSLLEMMISMTIFLILAGSAFGLLIESQYRQRSDTSLLDSFQAARLSLDEIVRDVGDAGYPPASFFQTTPADQSLFARAPFAWSTGYQANNPCTVNATCITPNDFDLIIETNLNPDDPGGKVKWVRYKLQGTTLLRAVVDKPIGPTDPDTYIAGSGSLVPYVENVMNNAAPARIAQIEAQYPGTFPGRNPVPLFTYFFDASGTRYPKNIKYVDVKLIVVSPIPDPKTGRLNLAELSGRARRVMPTQ